MPQPSPMEPVTPTSDTFDHRTDPSIQSTPLGPRHDADQDKLNVIRPLIAQVMNNEMVLCEFKTFMEHYGPRVELEDDDIARCRVALTDAHFLLHTNSGYKWTAYQENPPRKMTSLEDIVFRPLDDIVKEIFKYAGATGRRGNNYVYQTLPYAWVKSNIAGANHRMDACIVTKWAADALPADNAMHKKYRTHSQQILVRQQIVGNAQHIMSEDASRMFTYGVTIENDRFSAWYFSRSHSVKAFSFDWLSDSGIDNFIRFYLTVALATPEELGVDPHVLKIPRTLPTSGHDYIYICPQHTGDEAVAACKYFKTSDHIGPMRPLCISGRITRIWKVVEVRSPDDHTPITGTVLILKDVWLDRDRSTEAQNLESIMADVKEVLSLAKKKYGGDDWLDKLLNKDKRFAQFDRHAKDRLKVLLTDENYKSLFLTKVEAWTGKESKSLVANAKYPREDAPIFAERPVTASDAVISYRTTQHGPESLPAPQSDTPNRVTHKLEVNPRSGRKYAQKRQTRFVYREVCSELYLVGTLGSFMKIMDQALTACQILFLAGWLHRDISRGNVLAFRSRTHEAWSVKLCDLEFARRFDDDIDKHQYDPRTASPYFMPYEIMRKTHILDDYRGRSIARELSLAGLGHLNLTEGSPEYKHLLQFKMCPDLALTSIPADARFQKTPKKGSLPRFNYQHDLESIWWLVLYFMLRAVDYRQSMEYAKLVFTPSLTCSQARTSAFTTDLDNIPSIHPKLVDGPVLEMEKLRGSMVANYFKIEVFGLLEKDRAYSSIHALFATTFRELLANDNGGWQSLPLVNPMEPLPAGQKRALDEEEQPEELVQVKEEEPEDYTIPPSPTRKKSRLHDSDAEDSDDNA